MPIVSRTRGFQGRARVSLTPLSGGRKFQLGNTTAITENVEVERTARQNFQESGGGELDVNETVTSITASLTVDDIKPETIAIGLRAEIQRLATAPITGEKHAAWAGERVSFKYIPDPDVAVTVAINGDEWAAEADVDVGQVVIASTQAYVATAAGTTDDTAPVWPTEGGTVTDGTVTWKHVGPASLPDTAFARTKQGVQFAADSALFVDAHVSLPIVVGYTINPQFFLQAFVNSGQEFLVEIDGENANDNGAPNIVRYFRAKPSPTSGFNRVSAEFATMELTLSLLEDPTRIGAGDSKYLEIAMV
ncbi:hypothetical protein E6C76_20115 [Pseudothauera nasutitermitis]|uniref:Major tail protein n=1 Tax=Pseudothauera nasutitermitis TaxID=2565930 RepID=A0A4S4AP16_9RHOO|nr:hypothetical protein [Pseudothauera nasutitermitis]THF61391.1 hypothetical protein E6C76_20115 [Pseudothauera nasutitermitis]